MRKFFSETFYRLVDLVPPGLKYRLARTPLVRMYRSISGTLGAPIAGGFHVIEAGPLQGAQLYTGFENVRGYPSIREYIQGKYEPGVADLLSRLCPVGGVVLDVGAHYGYFSLLMARLVGPTGSCIAFEASRANYEKILRTREANQVAQLKIEQVAISDKPGTVVFSDNINTLMGRIVEGDASQEPVTESVPSLTLDLYVEQAGLTRLDFIKMDIEGAERKALAGARQILQRLRPSLLVEVHTFVPPEEMARPLAQDLFELGYRLEYLSNRLPVKPETFIGGHILAFPEP